MLQPSSGILSLDKNQDGIVNSINKLFASVTGDGFSELAAHDENNNNGMDKSDAVYDRLSAWSKNPQTMDQMSGLQATNVGAIYLSSISKLFDLRDSDNQFKGQISAISIYAEVSNSSKTTQYLNLVA